MTDGSPVQGFAELTLACRDPERLARFYSEVFQMTRLSEEGDRSWQPDRPLDWASGRRA